MTQTKIGVGMINATSIGDAKVLQGDGSWVTPSAAGMSFISNTDISAAATYNFTSFTAGSYEHYQFVLQNLIPVTDNVELNCRTSTDGGSSYDSGGSDYSWGVWSGTIDNDTADSEIALTGDDGYTVGSAANESGISGNIWLHAPHTTSYTHVSAVLAFLGADGVMTRVICSGLRASAADVDGFQVLFSSGNIESGTITVYGLANA